MRGTRCRAGTLGPQEWRWYCPHGHESPESYEARAQISALPWTELCIPGQIPSHLWTAVSLRMTGIRREGLEECPVFRRRSSTPAPFLGQASQVAAGTALGLAPENIGYGDEAGGARDLTTWASFYP